MENGISPGKLVSVYNITIQLLYHQEASRHNGSGISRHIGHCHPSSNSTLRFFLTVITVIKSILLLLFRQRLHHDMSVLFDRFFYQYHRLDSVDIWITSVFFELQNSLRYGCKRESTEITSVVVIYRDN